MCPGPARRRCVSCAPCVRPQRCLFAPATIARRARARAQSRRAEVIKALCGERRARGARVSQLELSAEEVLHRTGAQRRTSANFIYLFIKCFVVKAKVLKAIQLLQLVPGARAFGPLQFTGAECRDTLLETRVCACTCARVDMAWTAWWVVSLHMAMDANLKNGNRKLSKLETRLSQISFVLETIDLR